MIFVLLPLVGLIISNAYEKHMIAGINNELSAYSYSILAIVEVENNQLIMPEQLLETQFNVSQSGLYAVLTSMPNSTLNGFKNKKLLQSSLPKVLWSSQSLLLQWPAKQFRQPSLGQSKFYQTEIESTRHFVYSLSVSYGSEAQPYPMTLHIIKQQNDLAAMMAEFHQKLLLGLSGLMLILLLFQYLWSIWTLKPLKTLRSELKRVEQGKIERLEGFYPTELSQVTEQLNLLLNAEQKQRQRYRNSLSDLAHSLKTPLAVIQSQQQLSQLTIEQLGIINAMVDHQLRKAQSAGQSSWHLGTKIAPIANKLISSLEKIYREKAITFTIDISPESVFKGDEADLLEILGNLIDNACKAAINKVSLKVVEDNKMSSFIIEDDGGGIPQSLRDDILQRGTRADTYLHGHGIGLAIVRDLVDSYQGSITIDTSTLLTGAKFTLSFSQ
jgi:two-component system sensor histidine kinase PhoQ